MRHTPKPIQRLETEQIAVRLPVAMVEQFRNGRGLSKEIQERLVRSILADNDDPALRELAGQIEQLAKRVRRQFGAEWHADMNAHRAFVDAVSRFMAWLPEPAERAPAPADPAVIGRMIFSDFLGELREIEQTSGEKYLRRAIAQKLKGQKS